MGQICSTTQDIPEDPGQKPQATHNNAENRVTDNDTPHFGENNNGGGKYKKPHPKRHGEGVMTSQDGKNYASHTGGRVKGGGSERSSSARVVTLGDLTEGNLRAHTKVHAYNKRKSIVDILTDAESDSVSSRSNSGTINYSEAGLQPYNPTGITVVNDNGEVNGMLLPNAADGGGGGGGGGGSTRHRHRKSNSRSASRSTTPSTRSPRRVRRTSRTPPVATLHETNEEHRTSNHQNDHRAAVERGSHNAATGHASAVRAQEDVEVSYKKSRSSRHNSAATGQNRIRHSYGDRNGREGRQSRSHKKLV